MGNLGLIAFFVCYLLALLGEVLQAARNWVWLRWPTLLMTLAGLGLHTAYLMDRYTVTKLPPLVASSHDWWLVFAWVTIVIYLMSAFFSKSRGIGLFILPCAIAIVILAMGLNRETNMNFAASSRMWKMLHTISLVFGFVGLFIGVITSLMYLLQHLRLKRKWELTGISRLPSLEDLSWWNFWAVISTAPNFTIGLITGLVLAFQPEALREKLTLWDPFIIGFIGLWGVMLGIFVLLVLKLGKGGKQVMLLTLWSCLFVIFTAWGLNMSATFASWHH
jgi:ABC-type uncharacterized transport system permease subunit